jgi:hypothetical protein
VDQKHLGLELELNLQMRELPTFHLSTTCCSDLQQLVSSKDAQRVLLRQRVLWTLRVFKQQSWMTGLSVKPQTVNLGCALSVAFRAGLTVRPEI